VFESKVLRRIFGPKRDEVTGGRRRWLIDSDVEVGKWLLKSM
jgi:hypothetical protein